MALSKKLIAALADALATHAPKDLRRSKEEEVDDYVRRVMPAVAGELRQTDRLSPLEAGLYDLPENALLSIARKLDFDEKEVAAFKKLEKSEQVTQLSRLHDSSPSDTFGAFYAHLFAARTSIQQYQLEGAPYAKGAKHHLTSLLGRDPFAGEPPEAVGSEYQITSAVELGDKVYCITFSKAVESYEAVGNDFRLTSLSELQHVHLIINPITQVAEFRGAVAQAPRVLVVFAKLMREASLPFGYELMPFTQSDADALRDVLGATLKRVKHVSEANSEDGLGSVLSTVSPAFRDQHGRNDLRNAPGFVKLEDSLDEDTLPADWDLVFLYEDVSYTVQIHLKSGSLRFPEGIVTDRVIRYVTDHLHRIRTRKPKTA